jgi:hypothetical protein
VRRYGQNVPVSGSLVFEVDQDTIPTFLQIGNFYEDRYRIRLDSVDDVESPETEESSDSAEETGQEDESSTEEGDESSDEQSTESMDEMN